MQSTKHNGRERKTCVLAVVRDELQQAEPSQRMVVSFVIYICAKCSSIMIRKAKQTRSGHTVFRFHNFVQQKFLVADSESLQQGILYHVGLSATSVHQRITKSLSLSRLTKISSYNTEHSLEIHKDTAGETQHAPHRQLAVEHLHSSYLQ